MYFSVIVFKLISVIYKSKNIAEFSYNGIVGISVGFQLFWLVKEQKKRLIKNGGGCDPV